MDEVEGNRQATVLSFGQVAAALSALRASNRPAGLARAVSRLLVGAGAACCRIDLPSAPIAPVASTVEPGEAPDPPEPGDRHLTAIARSVEPDRPELSDPARDPGTAPAADGRAAVLDDPDRNLVWVVVPLVAGHDIGGALRVALPGNARPAPDVLAFLHHIGASLGLGLAAAEWQERAERVSQSLQDSLLPAALPAARWFRLAARYEPATAGMHVGGDWYDAQLIETELAVSVGDVAGHGVEAAARMGQLRSAMTALRLLSRGPDDLILHLHRLCDLPEHFATAICARIEPNGTLLWASAGHFSPVVAHADGTVVHLDGETSPPLGSGSPPRVVLHAWHLSPGDTVVLFTDGLVERRDETLTSSVGVLLDEIGHSIRAGLGPEALVDRLLRARKDAGPTSDDIAVLAVQVSAGRSQESEG
jgi:hypothetical protein